MPLKFSVTKFFPRKDEGKGKRRAPRIPFGLQALFIASNRGKAVHKPAPAQRVEVTAPVEKIIEQPVVPETPVIAPQDYLDSILKKRGYSTKKYSTLETGYRIQPTELQVASHGTHLVSLVRNADDKQLRKVMRSGISPNPCNVFGESLLHMVCRHGNESLVSCMLDAGSDVQVSDDYGRTPLHDSCWAPKPDFDAVVLVVNRDRDMFCMMDKRNCTPLGYVRKENWAQWNAFLDEHKDYWWPEGGASPIYVPPMAEVLPMSRQIPDPKNALSLELAKLVAGGRMSPADAQVIMEGENDQEDEDAGTIQTSMSTLDGSDSQEDLDDSDYDSEYDSEDDSSYDSDDSYDSDEDYDDDDFGTEGFNGDMDDEEVLRQVERVLNF